MLDGGIGCVGMAECERMLMIDSDFVTFGFDRTNLERETKEIEKMNEAQKRAKLPTKCYLPRVSIGFFAPHTSSLSRVEFSRVS